MNNLIKFSAIAAGCALFAILPASTVYAVTDLSDYIYDYADDISVGYADVISPYYAGARTSYYNDDISSAGGVMDLDSYSGSSRSYDYIGVGESYDSYNNGISEPSDVLDLDAPVSTSRAVSGSIGNVSYTSASSSIKVVDDIGATKPAVNPSTKPSDSNTGSSGKSVSGGVTSDASRALGTINSLRAKKGAGALTFNADLNRVAALRAEEATRKFSHTRPNGKNGVSILAENGISYGAAGENIACTGSSAESAVSAWARSAAHSRCMLDSGYAQAGLASATVGGTTVWVLILTD